MYDILFPAATTSAGWWVTLELINDDTDLPLGNLDEYTAELKAKDSCGIQVLAASSAEGSITIDAGASEISWQFTAAQISGIDTPKTLDVGLVITFDSGQTQLLIGKLPVIDGIV